MNNQVSKLDCYQVHQEGGKDQYALAPGNRVSLF